MGLETLIATIPKGAELPRWDESSEKKSRRHSQKLLAATTPAASKHRALRPRDLQKSTPSLLRPSKERAFRLSIGRMQGILQDFDDGLFNVMVWMQTEVLETHVLMELLSEGKKHHRVLKSSALRSRIPCE